MTNKSNLNPLQERIQNWQTNLSVSSFVDEIHSEAAEIIKLLLEENDRLQTKLCDAEATESEVERLAKQCEGLAQSAMNNGQALILAEAKVEMLRKAAENALACGFLPKDQANELRAVLRSK